MVLNCIFVGVGGMLGSVARYLMSLIPLKISNGFPLMTLLINVLGALLIGLIVAWTEKTGGLSAHTVLLLKVGLCGGFTTFSTFALETEQLLQSGRGMAAAIYAVLSVILCVLAVFAAQTMVHLDPI